MSDQILKESRAYILRGVICLLLGSALVLVCKLPLPELLCDAAVFAGAVIILWGNGCILFGLLVFAGSRT